MHRRLADVLIVFSASLILTGAAWSEPTQTVLRTHWQLQSACKLPTTTKGDSISTARFKATGWIATEVPHTVEGAQVDAKVFPFDPFYGMKLRDIPGTTYPVHKIFAYIPMPGDSPYRCAWWYRTEFRAPIGNRRVWLRFDGINYRANIWLNGKKIADQQEVAGAYRTFRFDVSDKVRRTGPNVLAVETFAQTEADLGISYLDWAPGPADKSMGLWREVVLETSGPVQVRYPMVNTHFTDDSLKSAELTVTADVVNATSLPQAGTLTAQIGAQQVHQIVAVGPSESKSVTFAPIRVVNPKVWWPHTMGAQPLENVTVSYVQHGAESDRKTATFGVREITASLNESGALQFQVNRKRVLIRGGGWTPDMFLREPRERLAKELAYVKDLGLNTIRLEGKMGSDDLFDLADRTGILIMAGWMCCDHWQEWAKWTEEDHKIAHESQYSQISRLRHHPSMLVWLNGSDLPPVADVERDYISVLQERSWPNPYISSASADRSQVTGPSGVKMSGPYDYVPPEYWYLDKSKYGGAWSFNTETSAGAAVPELPEIERVVPKAALWPMSDVWNYHAGEGRFAQYDNYVKGMNAIYGTAQSAEDFVRKSQLMSYEGERAMFEAYARRRYTSTGVIQWMLNNAWPSFYWHLYDYYLVPAAGYFATKKATEPLHIQYAYDDRSVAVVNSTYVSVQGLRARALVFSSRGKELSRQEQALNVEGDSVANVLTIPQPDGYDGTQIIRLQLTDANGKTLSDNVYWVAKNLSDLNWSKTDAFITPANQYSNMQDLAAMPAVHLSASHKLSQTRSGETVVSVSLSNPAPAIALAVHARVVNPKTGVEIAPVFWDDNYVTLFPGESKTITARFKTADVGARTPDIKLSGWNLK